MEGHFQAETKCGTLAADNFCGDAGKQKPNLDFLQLDSSAESQFKLVEFWADYLFDSNSTEYKNGDKF